MILIVDDATDDVELVKAMLSANGFTVRIAKHGKEGLAQVKKLHPQLIISDVLMPEMDGFTFFKELKKNPDTAAIPILILTVRGRMRDTFEAFGVQGFVPKPFDAQGLFSIISKYVTPAAVSQSASPAPAPAPAPAAPAAPAPQPAAKAPAAKPDLVAAAATRKALIFGSDDHVLENMAQLLGKEKCHAIPIKNESHLPVQVDSMEPDLIFLQLNTQMSMPIDRIVALLVDLIKKKKPGSKGPAALLQKGNIVIYKVEEERGGGLDGANIADTETLLERCMEEGCKKYISTFSPTTFISKVKEFLV